MRESIEIVHTTDFEQFLKHMFPLYLRALAPALFDEMPTPAAPPAQPQTFAADGTPPAPLPGQCAFAEHDELHRTRLLILEILHRLPTGNEILKVTYCDSCAHTHWMASVQREDAHFVPVSVCLCCVRV